MNALKKDLMKLVEQAESNAKRDGRFRQELHLMPPVGWLNDPNGFCQLKGIYHAFFQYSPFDISGGLKMWGHYTSRDMIVWQYEGVAIYPDQPFDCHGIYSGCALVENDEMYLYYTGNVRLEDGENYDYVLSGREANTILVKSQDGIRFGRKRLLMRNSDYPANLTLHVRDPKVWKEGVTYYMLQGARTKDDRGEALLFHSEDKVKWEFDQEIQTDNKFGYMWECPDYFTVGGKKVLSVSVQGLTGKPWDEGNIYHSGYFLVDGSIFDDYRLSGYRLWDYGFDYYAPQSFATGDGRRILIAWMGMPDCEDYTNRTIEEGWQHCFTFPREIFVAEGKIRQRPVRELEERRCLVRQARNHLQIENDRIYEIDIKDIQDNRFQVTFSESLILEYADHCFVMRFSEGETEHISGGRRRRYAEIESVSSIKILADVSSVEVFVNDGEVVFSTRYYPERYKIDIEAEGADIRMYSLLWEKTGR